MRRWSEPRRLALLAALAAALPAQAPKIEAFQTPDGSRCLLVPVPGSGTVTWTIATPATAADEPTGLGGLAAATLQASLRGTWRTGSKDAVRERVALDALDQAWFDLRTAPAPSVQLRLATSQLDVANLGDEGAWLLALAKAPAHGAEVVVRDGVGLLQVTTIAEALPEVANRLLERREEQALRGFGDAWMKEAVARQNAFDADPASPVRAELLALAMPNHPLGQAGERVSGMPRRAQLLANWAATQRPERTVHVLLGDFATAATRQLLERTFAATQLPSPPAASVPALRAPQSLRRSTVPGVRVPTVGMAWVLPAVADPHILEVAAGWLGGGPGSWIGKQLAAAGRKTTTVACLAPWPPAVGGQTLLRLEVQDPVGIQGLADLLVQATNPARLPKLTAAELAPFQLAIERTWSALGSDPRWHAERLARQALLWPNARLVPGTPPTPAPAAVQDLLLALLANQPVVVEGRP